ncbi:MAG: hypothetical protein IPJ65_34375 [Archangiaceae bacterium]|nr:hypothetical protein [Archangiaceae bacterium]
MPAEAVHLSAFADSRVTVPHVEAARLGALFVDLPYFESFPLSVARYLFKRPPATSRWGDVTHQKAPIAVGRGLMEEGVRLGGADGAWLRSLALGYVSHAAVDRSMHPFVNRLAAARAARLGDAHARQHQEVEKYQSILFHDARLGFEVMGTRELHAYCTVDASPLHRPGAIAQAVDRVLLSAWGVAPGLERFSGWARGYAQYIALISSPLGKRVAPPAQKERERPELFPQFEERFARAVQQSRTWVETLAAYGADARFDASARAELERVMPEGTIDPPAEAL